MEVKSSDTARVIIDMLAESLAYNRIFIEMLCLKTGYSDDQLKQTIAEALKNLKDQKSAVLHQVLAHYGNVDFDGLLSDDQKDEN